MIDKKIAAIFSLLLLFFGLSSLALAQNPAMPSPPTIDASSYIMVDYYSGRVLAEFNSTEQLEPASLTKMMTVYVAGDELKQGHIHLDDEVLVSEKAWRMGGSRMFIEVGAHVSVKELLKGITIQSGNDASVALAEHISGSEEVFVQLMNQTAAKLGMEHTHFVNSTGMPAPGHVTTAKDLAILAAALIRDHPDMYDLHSIKEFTYNDIHQFNRNQLLWRDDSVDGIKTGHTESAGYCLVASAKRGEMRLITVVMGTDSTEARTSASRALLEYGFRFFDTRKVAEGNQKIGSARVWKGLQDEVNYGLTDDLYVTVPRGDADKLQQNVELVQPLIAPFPPGQAIGTLKVNLGDKTLIQYPLVALQGVEQGGFVSRLIDSVKLLLE